MKTSIHFVLGSLLFAGVNLSAATLYVSSTSSNSRSPYVSWTTAATNIQDAVNSAEAGDFIVVADGVYSGGVTVTNAVTLLSVDGPNSTVINSGEPCITLTNGASLIGFRVSGGENFFPSGAGGVVCASSNVFLINCVISNNIGEFGAAGVAGGTLNNCTIEDNENAADGVGGVGGATLNNCTITGNVGDSGGGAGGCTLNYCIISGNGGPNYGGGAIGCTLNNCIISGNSCGELGGGVYGCILNDCLVCNNGASAGGGAALSSLTNCTLTGNSSTDDSNLPQSGGGGALDCTLNNCISYFNTSPAGTGTNYDSNSTLNYCCTLPLPTNGIGNITNNPGFVNLAAGDFQLQSNSPCINAGNNAYVVSAADLEGNPRIVGGTVDIGAYEYQTPKSLISYAYLQKYELPTDGSVDFADLDGSGIDVYEDWAAGLNPTNRASVLAMLSPSPSNNLGGITVTWKSVSGVQYLLQRSTNLIEQPMFAAIQENISGQAGVTSYHDPSATNHTPYFYRVGVVVP